MAKIVFLQQHPDEWVGFMYISSMLKSRGHQCDVLVEPLERGDIIERALSQSPDIVAFSCLTSDYFWALNQAEAVKQSSKVLSALARLPAPAIDLFLNIKIYRKVVTSSLRLVRGWHFDSSYCHNYRKKEL